MYPSSSEKLCGNSPSRMSGAFSKNESMAYAVPQQQEPNQVVLEKEKEEA